MTGPGLLRRLDNHLLREADWHVGIVRRPIHAFIGVESVPQIEWLPRPAPGRFLADPFAVEKDGEIHVFCEEYLGRKGRISHFAIGDPSVIEPIIQLPTHMSYPFVFEHDNKLYCVPETSQAGEVALYVCQIFPHVWTKVATLIDGLRGVDASLIEYADHWWMFVNDVDDRRLFIWHAPRLEGPWAPHALNPVKSDPRSARPAGRPFTHAGALFRPAQDCSLSYGQQVVLNRVTRLTTQTFEEEVVGVIRPDRHGPYPHGLHTVCAVGDLTIVDGKRLRADARAFARKSLAHARRLSRGR